MAARPLPKGDNPHQITINADGTWTPPGGVTINNSGTVKFDVDGYPPNMNECIICFTVSWGYQPRPGGDPGGTIKVGS